jgi:nanoRNase/pAp phosphatase (c-di-AMP/oligoRNAs hydrolase)
VGYVRAAGRVMKEAYSDIGSAGGHASMAKAIIPVAEIARKWDIDPRNLRLINQKIQKEFLKALHSEK